MRVIAGELGGRTLRAPRGRGVRPTSDRVREAIFSALGDVTGARVLDLYCGTGALAIEALSRGARSAVLVDREPKVARENVEALGLGGRAEVIGGDAARALARLDPGFDLIFCDPPYGKKQDPGLVERLDSLLASGGRVVLESSARTPFDLGRDPAWERGYGGTLVRIYAGLR